MKADVLQLVQDLSTNMADPVTCDRYYRDVVIDLGQRELLTTFTLIQHGIDLGNYDAPDSTLKILAVLYGDTQLSGESQKTIESVDPFWRQALGFPAAFVTETEGDMRFYLYPTPDAPSQDFSFVHGAPMGADFPANAIGIIFNELRTDLPVWLELPVALLILAREFNRESTHRDPAYAKACEDIGMGLLDRAFPPKEMV